MDARRRALAWCLVFALNLIVPILLASGLASGSAWVGVIRAVAAYWFAGIYACARSASLSWSLVLGGAIVGTSQIWPVLQMFAGLFALQATAGLGLSGDPIKAPRPLDNGPGGFVAAAVTGGFLLAVAFVCGSPLHRLIEQRPASRRGKPSVNPSFDRELDG